MKWQRRRLSTGKLKLKGTSRAPYRPLGIQAGICTGSKRKNKSRVMSYLRRGFFEYTVKSIHINKFAADSKSCTGKTDMSGGRPAREFGKQMPGIPLYGMPKQQPDIKQPIRPKEWPKGINGTIAAS